MSMVKGGEVERCSSSTNVVATLSEEGKSLLFPEDKKPKIRFPEWPDEDLWRVV